MLSDETTYFLVCRIINLLRFFCFWILINLAEIIITHNLYGKRGDDNNHVRLNDISSGNGPYVLFALDLFYHYDMRVLSRGIKSSSLCLTAKSSQHTNYTYIHTSTQKCLYSIDQFSPLFRLEESPFFCI